MLKTTHSNVTVLPSSAHTKTHTKVFAHAGAHRDKQMPSRTMGNRQWFQGRLCRCPTNQTTAFSGCRCTKDHVHVRFISVHFEMLPK